MKVILSTFIFIALISQSVFSQDIIKPSPPCSNCPEWAKNMSQYEWESWKEQDQIERENAVIKNSPQIYHREDYGQIKAGGFFIAGGAILEIIALSMDLPNCDPYKDGCKESISDKTHTIKAFTMTGLAIIGLGGVMISMAF